MQHVAVSQLSTNCKTIPSNGCYDNDGAQVAPTSVPGNGSEDIHHVNFYSPINERSSSLQQQLQPQPQTEAPSFSSTLNSDSSSATSIASPFPKNSKHIPLSPASCESPSSVAIGTVNGASNSVYVNSVSSVDSPVTVIAPIPQKVSEGSKGLNILTLSQSRDVDEEEDADNTGASLPPPPSPTRLSFGGHSQFEAGVEGDTCSGVRLPDSHVGPQRFAAPVLTPNLDPASVDLVTQRMHKVMGGDDELDRRSIYHQPPKAADRGSAARLAKRLFHLDGFRLGDVFKHLCKKNDFSQLVGEEYLNFFDFTGESLDVALRSFLSKFTLMGETQERERVLSHYSRRFMQCNPKSYNSEDACHTLVCAMMLLNTDLHGHRATGEPWNVLRKMSCQDFIGNLAELNNGQNFDREELKALYEAIKEEPIQWPQEILQPPAGFGPQNMSEEARRILSGGLTGQNNPFLEVPNPNDAQEYRRGYLYKKCVMDAHGKKTALGKRKWKSVYAVLRDLILYLYKNEGSVPASFINPVRIEDPELIEPSPGPPDTTVVSTEGEGDGDGDGPGDTAEVADEEEDGRSTVSTLRRAPSTSSATSTSSNPSCGAIRVHHSMAVPAPDYTKRPNVFRLTTADGAVFLLQATSSEAANDWCCSLNLAAARLSAAPMAAAVGSERGRDGGSAKWHRPLLPAFYTQSNTRDQLEQHQKRVLDFTHARQEHGLNPPKKSDKGRTWNEYNEKKTYLDFELERYKTYARILERQLALQFTQPGPMIPGVGPLAQDSPIISGGDFNATGQLNEENGGDINVSERYPSAGFAPFSSQAPDSKLPLQQTQQVARQPMIYQNQGAVYEII